MIFEILVKMAIQIMGKNLENQKYVDFVKIRKFTLAIIFKRLDLLSEHPEKNLSQNLFNKNSYQVKK